MRFTSSSKSVFMLLASVSLITACSTPVKLDPTPAVVEKSAPVVAPAPVDTRAVNTVTAPAANPLVDPSGVLLSADSKLLNDPNGTLAALRSTLAKRSVYFDYDSYVVKDEFKTVVDAHAKYLVANKGRKILVQGNADERGGREYNLALGQKRAEAVRKALSLLSVPETQVEAVSLGEEKPKATGSDEASWAENRRSDIIYQ
jgi:peptidoglycan-associated lipoprotein